MSPHVAEPVPGANMDNDIAEIESAFRSGVSSHEEAERLTRPLFRTLLFSRLPPGRTWRQLAELCDAALRALEPQSTERDALDFARRIAARHDGEPAVIPWPADAWLAALPPAERDTALAHVVQSAADGDLQRVEEYCRRAQDRLDELSGPESLRLAGAVGRGFAAVGRFDDAVAELTRAITGWLDIDQASEASYPLSELLRYAGLAGDAQAVGDQRALVSQFRRGSAPMSSRVFVRLALGRAWIQVGELQKGIDELLGGDDEWAGAIEADAAHGVRSRWRWLHYAALGRGAEANRFLEALAAEGESDQLHLARIDLAIHEGRDPSPHLHALLALPREGTEVARALARLGATPGNETPKSVAQMAWEYRY